NEKHRIFFRMNSDFWEEHKNNTFPNESTGIILNRENKGISFDDVYVFTPSFLMNVRYGMIYGIFTERRRSRGFDLASLGFWHRLVGLVPNELAHVPNVQVGSLTQLGNWESGDGGDYSTAHSWAVTFTRLQGNHNLRFGSDFRVYRENFGRYPNDLS